jgi:surface polysaccharide O-acyltransferase-like enzyme
MPSRLFFIDSLRVLIICLVVAHHAGQAYGPTGGDWPIFSPERTPLLGPFFPVNAAFFMGLFFLISGYFVPGSFDRKGAGIFIKDRLRRLGIPLLFMGFVVFSPFVYSGYASQEGGLSFWQFYLRIYIGQWQVEIAHMWFVAHLLAYAIGYTLWRLIRKRRTITSTFNRPVPGNKAILTFTIALALVTAAVRIWYPIDRWEKLLFIIPSEIAHLPQYLFMFVLGIVAFRRDWFRRMPAKTGKIWLGIGLTASVARYAYSYWGWRLLPSITDTGGFSWRSLVWSTWEAFICIGMCVGLVILFRELFNKQRKFISALSDSAYTVYIIHLLVVVGLQFSIVSLAVTPFIKFTFVTLVGIPLCFALSHLIKKLPFTRRIL